MKHQLILSLVLLAAACSADDPSPGADAGSGSDTAISDDTGSAPGDASTGVDAGGQTMLDGGVGNDGGNADLGTADVGAEDAGRDMQSSEDAGGDMTTPGGSPETCDTATDATAGGTFADDTTAADDDYSASLAGAGCPSGAVSGGDHVYSVAPAVETTYRIVVEPEPSFDPFLYVKSDCAIDACVDGTVLNGAGVQESLTVTVPAGEEYFVIVDGELLSEGAYTLTVTIE